MIRQSNPITAATTLTMTDHPPPLQTGLLSYSTTVRHSRSTPQAYIVENDPDALKVIHKVCSERGIDYEVLGVGGNVRFVTESDIERIVNESGPVDLIFTSTPCKVYIQYICVNFNKI